MSKQMPKFQVKNGIRWLSWSVSVAVAIGLLVNIPGSVIGQSQPPQSAEQRAALEEAKRLNQQAFQLYKQGNYNAAIPLAERALAIREKVLGKEHPDVAASLNNLAELYLTQGNYQKAEPLYLRSLAILEKVLGNVHPNVATNLNNLAGLYEAQGDITRATDFLSRGLAVQDHNLALIFAVGSEQRKQDYARTFMGTTDEIISLSQEKAANNAVIAKLALTTVLRRKGLVLDAVTDSIQTLRSQLASKPEKQKLFDQWLNVQQQQSALVYQGQGKQSATDYQAHYQQLETEKERLEEAISVSSAEFRNATQPVELQAIQGKIPQDTALVEIVQYQPFNPKAKHTDRFGKPRYAAAVLRSEGEPKWVNLGVAATIDKSAANFRMALQNRLRPVDFEARTLDEQLMAPIRPLLGNARHVLLSSDGQLTLIPFEALKNEQGQYLIQRYSFSYLTTGRDLLRFQSPASSRSAPVVLADIDYNQSQTVAVIPKSTNSVDGSQNRRSVDLANVKVPSLAATKDEAAAIKKTFPNANILLGAAASETAVKQLHGPSILHLATHAFFFPDLELDLKPSLESGLGQHLPKALQLENPLLRSGLALAGFNKRFDAPASSDDGVLTSLEVAGLDLRGTQLIVLSACETGLGDVKVGNGVYGLRRALVIAGSQSQVLSLWEVDDSGTKDLMEIYYQGLKAGIGRHQALQDAQLKLLSNPSYQHPYYWASFVASGDWTPLHMGR